MFISLDFLTFLSPAIMGIFYLPNVMKVSNVKIDGTWVIASNDMATAKSGFLIDSAFLASLPSYADVLPKLERPQAGRTWCSTKGKDLKAPAHTRMRPRMCVSSNRRTRAPAVYYSCVCTRPHPRTRSHTGRRCPKRRAAHNSIRHR